MNPPSGTQETGGKETKKCQNPYIFQLFGFQAWIYTLSMLLKGNNSTYL